MRRGLLALPLSLALIAPGATALGAEATTGYSQTTPPPTTVTTTVTTPPTTVTTTTPGPKQEVKPETNKTVPTVPKKAKHGVHNVTTTEVSTTVVTVPHATTLPFTGLDLRWVIVGGMLLLGTGLSIMYVQRGRHGTGR